MTTAYVPADPRNALIDVLADKLAADHPQLTVTDSVPKGWTADPGASPLLTVEHDGTPVDHWPVATVSTYRLTTWTRTRDSTILRDALAVALAVPIPGVDRAKPGTWPIEARDATTRAHLQSATVRLTARTTNKEIS